MLTVKKNLYDCKWNALIFNVQKIWSPSYFLVMSSISIRTIWFHLDDCLMLHTGVNSCSRNWSLPRVHCIQNCQIIPCPMCSFSQPLHLTLTLYLFVIVNNIWYLINKLWLLPRKFFSVSFFFFRIASMEPPDLSFMVLELKKLENPDLTQRKTLIVKHIKSHQLFTNGPGDLGSIPGRVILKTQKMVLDASLHNSQHFKIRIKDKVEQSRERSSALPYTLV